MGGYVGDRAPLKFDAGHLMPNSSASPNPGPQDPNPPVPPLAAASVQRIDQFEARAIDLVIRLALLGLFVYWTFGLIGPFIVIGIWAVVLAVILAPVHRWLAGCIGGRQRLAATLITIVALLIVIGPVAALSRSFIENTHELIAHIEAGTLRAPPLPPRLAALPVIGQHLSEFWAAGSAGIDEVISRYYTFFTPLGTRLLGLLSEIGFDLLRFLVSTIVAGVLLVRGPGMAHGGRILASRIVAPRGAEFVDNATRTIRNVSRGVIGVSALQTLAIGVVFQLAEVPSAGILTFVILFLCIIQIGPGIVVLPVLIWAWLTMPTLSAVLLTVALVPLTLLDNVLKPLLMGRGLKTPPVVIFMGVVGGTLSYGLIGLFLGPVVLGVCYDLLVSWTLHDPRTQDGAHTQDSPSDIEADRLNTKSESL